MIIFVEKLCMDRRCSPDTSFQHDGRIVRWVGIVGKRGVGRAVLETKQGAVSAWAYLVGGKQQQGSGQRSIWHMVIGGQGSMISQVCRAKNSSVASQAEQQFIEVALAGPCIFSGFLQGFLQGCAPAGMRRSAHSVGIYSDTYMEARCPESRAGERAIVRNA